MSTFETILLMLLVVDAIALAALVLLQQGRGADVGAAFGSGSSNTMFGGAGTTSFLTKLTAWLAIAFFLIAFGLAYTAKERAMGAEDLGVPTVLGPEIVEPDQLTPDSEGVDSDVPDI
ncbi:MAG: preprotein translocase subunit SecG [Gammaproteobacteria bacterium]|nr:preprotein translocase subunit SecG [Gammaproteobacteria bacterium]